MGADYYKCDSCTCTICLGNDGECNCECETTYCTATCGKLKNYKDWDDDSEDDWDKVNYAESKRHLGYRVNKDLPVTCSLCRREKYNDVILFDALMKHCKLTKAQVVKIWKKQQKI